MCDDHDLTVVAPAPQSPLPDNDGEADRYLRVDERGATDWTSLPSVPPEPDHGPGSPDDSSTGRRNRGPDLTDPVDGVWHIRSVASLRTRANLCSPVVTLTTAARPQHATTPTRPRSTCFMNYPSR